MAHYALKAKKREGSGKGLARQLRRGGWIPAVLYGEGGENEALAIEARQLDALFRTAGRGSHLLDLEIENGKAAKSLVLLREIQMHPARDEMLHVDLQRVSLKKKMHLSVPVVLVGEPVGVKTSGGVLELLTRELEIQCLPDQMPDEIRVDVSGLDIGQSLHVSDLRVEGVTILAGEDTAVATVARPTKIEEVKPAVEEAAEEGEEPKEEEAPATAESSEPKE